MKTEIRVETDTYPNGQKWHEIPYVNGQEHGLATWWHDNGQKGSEITYVNGQEHGLATWWNENGQKRSEITYVNGQVHGLATWWFSDGSLSTARKWHQDQLVWEINFPFQKQILENAKVELFFHETINYNRHMFSKENTLPSHGRRLIGLSKS